MTTASDSGWAAFAAYAYPPNELGYCGPPDSSVLLAGGRADIADYARGFDGAWPYLKEIAAAGHTDPLHADVVRAYWVGGPLLDRVDASALLTRLRHAMSGQPCGLLGEVTPGDGALANHSFHVFVVYPWVRFLDQDPATPLRILQSCRIRWGTVDSVDDENGYVLMTSRPSCFDGRIRLGDPVPETVRWRSADGTALVPRPENGAAVAAHWDWICGVLDEDDVDAVASATTSTLDLVNRLRCPASAP